MVSGSLRLQLRQLFELPVWDNLLVHALFHWLILCVSEVGPSGVVDASTLSSRRSAFALTCFLFREGMLISQGGALRPVINLI